MVGSGAAHAAAVEERRKKLQDYLAAKGKLRCANTKPYLREQKQRRGPPEALSTTGRQDDPIKRAQRPAEGRPTAQGLQPGSSDVRGTRPTAAAPQALGKGPAWGCLPSRPLGLPSGHRPTAAHPPLWRLPRPSSRSHEAQNVAGAQIPRRVEPVCKRPAREQLVGDSEETDKENQPGPAPAGPERRPQAGLSDAAGPKGGSGPADGGAARGVLKEQSHRLFIHKSHAGLPGGRCPKQIPDRSAGERPKAREPRTASAQSLSRTRESKKGLTEKEATRGHRAERSDGAKSPAPGRRLPQMKPPVLPVGKIKGQQHLRVAQPGLVRKPPGRAGSPSKAPARTPPRKQPQSLAPKVQRATSWNRSVNGADPRVQPGLCRPRPPAVPEPARAQAAGPCLKPRTQQKRGSNDRRKKLEEWLASKGKTYKRPPMKFLASTQKVHRLNRSFWRSMEEEEEEEEGEEESHPGDPDLSHRIGSTLAECLKLIEEGARSEEILAILSGIPQAEKFSTFWICKARLLAGDDVEGVMGLYEAAVRCGATPIQELRDVVLDILKSAKQTRQDAQTVRAGAGWKMNSAEERGEEGRPRGAAHLAPRERIAIGAADPPSLPCIKLQITPLPRAPGMAEAQDVKLVTPVRRSLRIEHAQPHYPERLREHGTVVASLGQLAQVAQAECYLYCKNEALPGDAELWLFAS